LKFCCQLEVRDRSMPAFEGNSKTFARAEFFSVWTHLGHGSQRLADYSPFLIRHHDATCYAGDVDELFPRVACCWPSPRAIWKVRVAGESKRAHVIPPLSRSSPHSKVVLSLAQKPASTDFSNRQSERSRLAMYRRIPHAYLHLSHQLHAEGR
jgi:hypothetical protein